MSADENVSNEVVEEKGIEETLELIRAIEASAVVGVTALADGFQFSDLAKFVSIYEPVATAVEGIQEVDDELKDLNETEAVTLGLAAYRMIKNIVAAVKDSKGN